MPSFGVGLADGAAEEPLVVRLVLAEEHGRASPSATSSSAPRNGCSVTIRRARRRRAAPAARLAVVPRPGVAVPRGRQHVQRVGLRAGVRDPDRHQQVVRVGLGVVDLDDPVAVVVEGAGVEQLVLGVELAAAAVLGDEVAVGELALRVVVAPAVPGVARQRVEVPPVLLGVLAVVALVAGQAEDALLQDRVAAVPEREREAQPLLDVARSRRARPRPSGTRASGRGRAGRYSQAVPPSL